ncbi:MAG: archaeosortase/exosortase family protein, partial [Candidatus Diapherotrites archaeon]|nr:archaeosortase/exosortase family protein [Candidatus Diapherotrites archaeon]
MELKKSIEFAIKFFLIYFVLQFLIYFFDLSFLENAIASFIAGILSLSVSGNAISFNETLFIITPNCTGLVSASVLSAVVFSLKKPELKEKIKIFLIGAVLLFLINLIRIYFVILAGIYFNAAELMHVISWFAMTAFILL